MSFIYLICKVMNFFSIYKGYFVLYHVCFVLFSLLFEHFLAIFEYFISFLINFALTTICDMANDNIIYKKIYGNENDMFAVSQETKKMAQTGMFICIQGEVEIEIDEKNYILQKNSILIYYPYSILKVIRRSQDLEGTIIAIDIESVLPIITKLTEVDSLLDIRQNPTTVLSDEFMTWMREYILLYEKHMELAKTFAENEYRKLWQLNHLQLENVKTNLVLLITMAFTKKGAEVKYSVNRKDEITRKFLIDLRSFSNEQHEVKFYADRQFISMRYFSFVVKERTGKTPSQWIAAYLLNNAKDFLRNTNMSVKEISEKLNFPNQSYFGKWFKTHLGLGPMEFKKKEK